MSKDEGKRRVPIVTVFLPQVNQPTRSRLFLAVTAPQTVKCVLGGQLGYLSRGGFATTVVSSAGPDLFKTAQEQGVAACAVKMAREVAPASDLVSLVRLLLLIRRIRPELTAYGTPKASLLASIAALLCRVPTRIYMVHGLRFQTKTHLSRAVMRLTERITLSASTHAVAASVSVRDALVDGGLVRAEKVTVLGAGALVGVDLERYRTYDQSQTSLLQASLKIPAGARVIGFVGRLVRDKGVPELLDAFLALQRRREDVHLLLVGDFEEGDALTPEVVSAIEGHPQIHHVPCTEDVTPFHFLMDFLVLPTHREGFPTAILEAAAAGKPAVTTTATGAVDAVIHGETGLHVRVGRADELVDAMTVMLDDPARREQMGWLARDRAGREFADIDVWRRILEFYRAVS